MRAGRDCAADLVNMFLHCFGICVRHDKRDTGFAARADRAEEIGVFIPLILRLAWPRAFLCPLIDESIFLSHAHFILEPHFDRRSGPQLFHDLADPTGKVFLKVVIACASCAGCRGRALICEKPSFLSTRPRLTVDRSTPKRSSRTRFKSTQRQREMPCFCGSGPASTSCRSSSCCYAVGSPRAETCAHRGRHGRRKRRSN